jgi:EAL domain-containing protein (putative c-di-GMP-specific phosphodiesterase class I)
MPLHDGVLAYLEHRASETEPAIRTLIESVPFRIGRSRPSDLVIYSQRVSKVHAEIGRDQYGWYIADLESRTGTFVNGERVGRAPLKDGDVVHVAHIELFFGVLRAVGSRPFEATLGADTDEQQSVIRGTRDLQRILTERKVRAVFQPIVELGNGALAGFEALGRNNLEGVEYSPSQLFALAGERGKSAELSQLMRDAALLEAPLIARGKRLFLNLHPHEIHTNTLDIALNALASLRGHGIQPVLEVHEAVVTDIPWIRALKERLASLRIELAYDDFGAGQSRLMELTEAPPDVIKLDMSLIRGIDQAEGRLDLVAALVRVMRDMNVVVLAEGIETDGERISSASIGCQLGQGYFFGRPEPAAHFHR